MSIRLFIHAGTHKTATTAFQGVCFENRALLATWGVIYPFARQHSELAHQLQRGELNNLRCSLDLFRTKFADDNTLLLSGEDFENVLVGKLYYPINIKYSSLIVLLSFFFIFLFINPTLLFLISYKLSLLTII